MYGRWRHAVVAAGIITPLLGLSLQSAHSAGPPRAQIAARSLAAGSVSPSQPKFLKLSDSALEPLDWKALDGWQADDHAAAFATFLASCRPLLHTGLAEGEKRPMYLALTHACREAVAAGQLAENQARIFFERNFRPLRISKLGDSAGLLTGYYEPIVDGSRFPTGMTVSCSGSLLAIRYRRRAA